MSIVKMKRATLMAFSNEKEKLLHELQIFGGVQFKDITEENSEFIPKLKLDCDSESDRILNLEEELRELNFSINFIEKYKKKEKGLKALMKEMPKCSYEELKAKALNVDWKKIYEDLKGEESTLNNIENQISRKNSEIDSLTPYINFDGCSRELVSLKMTKAYIGAVPIIFYENFKNEIGEIAYLEKLGDAKDIVTVFVIALNHDVESIQEMLKKYSFSVFNYSYDKCPSKTIEQLKKEIEDLRLEEAQIKEGISIKERELEDIKLVNELKLNELEKAKVCSNFLKTDRIVICEGYIPAEREKEFQEIVDNVTGKCNYLEIEDVTEEEEVPVLLKNNSFVEPFESITELYSLPSYREIDPTPLFTPFMFIFFGMMLSDAGYGMLISICAYIAMKKLPLKTSTKRFMQLFFYLGISTMFFGFLYGSFFGDILKIKPLWIDPSTDPIKVLIVSASMGVIHIYLGLGIKAYLLIRDGKVKDAVCDVGFWYLTLTGCILMFLKIQPVGKYMAIAGAVGLVATQGRSNKSIVGKLGGGLFGLYGITGYLGDVLSYSRLLALGLSTGLIGSSFNLMIKLLRNPILMFTAGAVIFVFGHVFNLLVSALGAYVHACRLQYLEFFNKFYTGGGKPFKPLKCVEKYANINE